MFDLLKKKISSFTQKIQQAINTKKDHAVSAQEQELKEKKEAEKEKFLEDKAKETEKEQEFEEQGKKETLPKKVSAG